jgi:hypothetical protein
VALLLAATLMAVTTIGLTSSAPQTDNTTIPLIGARDRQLIETYYTSLRGTLAPGSLDRSTFSPEIEKALTRGSRVPLGLKKELERLPTKLESQLKLNAGDYTLFRLRHHVLLVNAGDLTIADVLRNVVP